MQLGFFFFWTPFNFSFLVAGGRSACKSSPTAGSDNLKTGDYYPGQPLYRGRFNALQLLGVVGQQRRRAA